MKHGLEIMGLALVDVPFSLFFVEFIQIIHVKYPCLNYKAPQQTEYGIDTRCDDHARYSKYYQRDQYPVAISVKSPVKLRMSDVEQLCHY